MNKKTVEHINNWFASECQQVLAEIPQGIKDLMATNKDAKQMVAESIARKKCFTVRAVLEYLDSLKSKTKL